MIDSTYAVVVNWNGGDANLACVRSLLTQGIAAERIVFVDNASTDGSHERVRAEFPTLRFERNANNVGYGDGTNQGIRIALDAGAELVWLVNNDVTLDDGVLPTLTAAFAGADTIGVVAPRVVYARDPATVWCAGGTMTYRQNLSSMIGHRWPDGPKYQRTVRVDYVPGCAMLVQRRVFEAAGLLDGEYFAYHEDVEFCLKARDAGFDVLVVGEARALHDAHHSTGGGYNARRKYMMGVNTVWFLRRHGTPARWCSFVIFDVLTLPLVLLYRGLRGEGGGALAKARGTWDGLRGRRVTRESVEANT